MKYREYSVSVAGGSEESEIVVAELADMGFSSFDETADALKAYIDTDICDRQSVEEYLIGTGYKYETAEIEQQNWNAVWESNFQPVIIDSRVAVLAPHHNTDGEYEHIVRIMPKMSFGTGHHQTTHLMISEMLGIDFAGKSVLDMGSGTGVLAILAVMRGAVAADAIDIDEWAYENCLENVVVNHTPQVTSLLGDVRLIDGRMYDIILANINLNILLDDMPKYKASLNSGGTLLMSGILESDVPTLRHRAESLGFTIGNIRTREGWAAVAAASRGRCRESN